MNETRREEIAALLRQWRWSGADLRRLTGWSKSALYRWRKRLGLSGYWTYRSQLKTRDRELWIALQDRLAEAEY